MPLFLLSAAFAAGGAIPPQYTCDGADISPPLAWSGAPGGTQSFALVVEDPDAPGGPFGHWAVYDMAPARTGLAAGAGTNRPGIGLREARNDFGRTGYGGPCPPPGPAHHYHFRLFAIGRPTLDLASPAGVRDVLGAAQPYVLRQAELVGTYRR